MCSFCGSQWTIYSLQTQKDNEASKIYVNIHKIYNVIHKLWTSLREAMLEPHPHINILSKKSSNPQKKTTK